MLTEQPAGSRWRGVAARAGFAVLRLSLLASPRPMVWVIRRQFAATGAQLAAALNEQAPSDVSAIVNEQYSSHQDAVLDVHVPRDAVRDGGRLPTVVWVHGGAFVGGSKDEIAGYLASIAARGFTVVGVNYALAPGARHPTPARQVMAALSHLGEHADRLHVDPERLVLAGDSAGAHISAQVAACVADAAYRDLLGIESTVSVGQLRGVALCCGIFDLALVNPDSPLRDFLHAVAWAYSGSRRYLDDDRFMSTMTVTAHVTTAFPPAFVTVGNADPLLAHSLQLAAALESERVDVETLFYPADHRPPLPHEYQFDLGLDDGRAALERLISFFRRCTALG